MDKDKAIVPVDETAATINMAPLLKLAAANTSPEVMRELVEIYREERQHEARLAFDRAFAKFQSECPPIPHDAKAKFATKAGSNVEYTYSTIQNTARVIDKPLHGNGFSYAWEDTVKDGVLTSVCVIRHEGGHSRTGAFQCPIDANPMQSKPQAVKGAMTFAHRCSLIAALGLTTADSDTDGAGEPEQTIGPGQMNDLEALMAEVGADRAKFLKMFDVDKLADLTVSNYKPAVRMLEAKRK